MIRAEIHLRLERQQLPTRREHGSGSACPGPEPGAGEGTGGPTAIGGPAATGGAAGRVWRPRRAGANFVTPLTSPAPFVPAPLPRGGQLAPNAGGERSRAGPRRAGLGAPQQAAGEPS